MAAFYMHDIIPCGNKLKRDTNGTSIVIALVSVAPTIDLIFLFFLDESMPSSNNGVLATAFGDNRRRRRYVEGEREKKTISTATVHCHDNTIREFILTSYGHKRD